MELVVEASSRRQLEVVGDIVDDGGDTVWPVEAQLELPKCWRLEGSGGTLAEMEPDLVAHGMANVPVVPFVVALVDGLDLLKEVADVGEEFIHVCHALGLCRHPRLAGFIGAISKCLGLSWWAPIGG